MKPRHQVSRAAIELIERFEGYRSKAARLPDGRWTIGYGHTQSAREGASVSRADAEALLIYDLIAVAHAVNELTYTPLTQNQFDALCAFAFNIGVENFRRSSVLRRVNEGQLLQAACAMELWRKADFEGERIVIDALVRRRAAEKALFLTPPGGFIPVPSPVLPPNLDLDGLGLVPREIPTAVTTAMDGTEVRVERDEPDAEPEPPTATEAAAAAVSARLAAIFADEEPEAEPPAAEAAEEPEAATEEVVIPESDLAESVAEEAPEAAAPQSEPEIAPEPVIEPELEPQADEPPPAPPTFAPLTPEVELAPAPERTEPETPPPPANDLADTAPAADQAFPRTLALEPEPQDLVETEAPKFSYLPLLGLAVLGGAVFGGGIFWAVSAQGGDGGAWALGWLAALLGIVILGRAAYLFLERLGQIGGGFDDQDLNRD